MYLPSAFRQNDLTALHAQMQASPFALLASAGEATRDEERDDAREDHR